MEKKQPPVIVICGVKNSGKTTLLERLLPRLTGGGRRVAVIKHDGHDFSCDVPDTDTFRLSASGAYGVAAFSQNRMFVHRQGTGETERELFRFFQDADLILVEGLKDSACRKIEVIRSAVSSAPASNPAGRFLIVTDLPEGRVQEPWAGFDDLDTIVRCILREIGE